MMDNWIPEGSHLGIELRVTINGAPLMVANSDMLHLIAKYSGAVTAMQTEADWVDTLGPIAPLPDGTVLAIQHRPVFLPNEYSDPEE